MKQKTKLFLMLMTMLISQLSLWGETITFVQTSSSAGTLTANSGITYTFSNTYTNNKEQITSGNTMTLTLSGFQAGDKITGITLNLRNNKSSGNGTVTATFGGTQIGSMAVTGLGNTYQSKSMSITETSLTAPGNLVILLTCSENSVFCNHFEITYTTNTIPIVSSPTFSPTEGTYSTPQSVTISSSTSGASIYYTTDGTTPTTNSTLYSGAIEVGKTMTIKAIATKTGMDNSNVAEATYTLKVATPYIGVTDASTTSKNISIYCSNTPGATIYYTIDGSDPSSSSTRIEYTGPFTLSKSATVKAYAVYGEMDGSEIAENVVELKVATPTFTPAGGTYASSQNVSIACSTEGATIYYTTDGTTPTTSSSPYSGPISVSTTTTIKAIAVFGEMDASEVASATYTIKEITSRTFFKATSESDLTEGMSIIIVNESAGKAMGAAQANNFSATGATFDTSTSPYTAIPEDNATIITLEGSSGAWYFNTGNGYLYAASSNSNHLKTEATADNNAKAAITFSNGNASITFQGSNSRNKLKYNSQSSLFSCYSSGQQDVQIYYQPVSSIAKPTITPDSGTFTEAQTITITNNAEGATVYYTLDGTTPTESSTPYTAPFVLKKNGTYTIKAIAISSEGSSMVTTATITINHTVLPPVFSEASGSSFTEPYTINLTAETGCTIYYSLGGESPVDNSGNLTSSAIAYNASTSFKDLTKAITITAVAVDNGGNISETVTANYKYSGTVQVPYYENFDEGLGNFTTNPQNSGTRDVAWEFQVNHDVATYGEERKYAYISGGTNNTAGTYVGSDRLISPVIDLSELENATMNFIHAGHWFGTASDGTDSGDSDDEAKKASCHLQIKTETGDWVDITDRISNWFVQSRVNGHNMYERVNSGDINLSDYAGNKVQICFYFTSTASQSGTWNVLKFAVTGTKPEESYETVTMSTDGYVTYVVQNDIDWVKTLAKNTTENGNNINIHGYKVVEFTKETAVFVEFGATNTSTTHDKWYSEDMIPAETPIILKGTQGDNNLVIAKHDDVISKPVGNLLKPSYGDVTASADQRLLVFQKEPEWSAANPYEHYAFYRLATGRTIPNRKAYLNGNDVVEATSIPNSNPTNGIYLLEDLGKDTSGIVDLTAQQPKAFDPNAAVYDLSGRKVAEGMTHLPKGLYIISGRKVVIR